MKSYEICQYSGKTKVQLKSFFMLQELVEKLSKGELPKNEYTCMNDPNSSIPGISRSASAIIAQPSAAHSMRSRRTASWARSRTSDDGYSRYVYCKSLYTLFMFL